MRCSFVVRAFPWCVLLLGCGDPAPPSTIDAPACTGAACTDAAPLFVLEVHTSLAGDALVLHTNLPARVVDCVAVAAAEVPCADLDGDALVDAWEAIVLDRLRPIQRFDEDESLIGSATAVLGDVGRVALAPPPTPGDPFRVHAMIMLGYSEDYGSCGGFTGHHGDSERVAVNLEQVAGTTGDVQLVAAFTTGHEGTSNDQSTLYDAGMFGDLVYETRFDGGEPRWVVFPSADKHATYATLARCEGVSVIPCVDEDCGPDGVGDPASFDRLPPIVNAGEAAAPLVTGLGALGFPGDDAWAAQEFCGGLDRTGGCSSAVRDKLLADPFGAY